MWKEGSRVFFRTIVEETGTPCLTGGYVDLFDGSAPAETQAPPPKQEEVTNSLTSSVIFFLMYNEEYDCVMCIS